MFTPRMRRLLSVLFLGVVILCLLIEKEVLFATDASIYAMMGKELSVRPFSEWCILTWFGNPFYEHPHFVFWLLGLSIKLFGATTLSVLLPSLIAGTLTILVIYFLASELFDHYYGVICTFLLVTTPLFVKASRNPMIEIFLIFFVYLSIFLGVKSVKKRNTLYSIAAGLAFGCGLLTKGPPALLTMGVLFVFCLYKVLLSKEGELRRVELLLSCKVIAIILFVGTCCLGFLDIWHYQVKHFSFLETYFKKQILFGFNSASSIHSEDFFIYFRGLYKGKGAWPWLPFAMLSIPISFKYWNKSKPIQESFLVIASLVFGGLFALTLIPKKNPWYSTLIIPGIVMLAGISLRTILPEKMVERHFSKLCLILGCSITFLCSIFPSIFEYPRPKELFLSEIGSKFGNKLNNALASDCIGLDAWTTIPQAIFYTGATVVPCSTGNAPFKFEKSEGQIGNLEFITLYSSHGFSLMARKENH